MADPAQNGHSHQNPSANSPAVYPWLWGSNASFITGPGAYGRYTMHTGPSSHWLGHVPPTTAPFHFGQAGNPGQGQMSHGPTHNQPMMYYMPWQPGVTTGSLGSQSQGSQPIIQSAFPTPAGQAFASPSASLDSSGPVHSVPATVGDVREMIESGLRRAVSPSGSVAASLTDTPTTDEGEGVATPGVPGIEVPAIGRGDQQDKQPASSSSQAASGKARAVDSLKNANQSLHEWVSEINVRQAEDDPSAQAFDIAPSQQRRLQDIIDGITAASAKLSERFSVGVEQG